MLKQIYSFSNGRGEVCAELLCNAFGDMTIRVHNKPEYEILELEDAYNKGLFNALFHLIQYHRKIERDYFDLTEKTAPLDRTPEIQEDISALLDTMEDVCAAIVTIAFGR